MDTNQILSADILDLLFDNRNKDYGAYELRRSYQARINKSLLITAVITTLLISSVFINRSKGDENGPTFMTTEVAPTILKPDQQPLERVTPPKLKPPLVKTVIFSTPVIKDVITNPPPTQIELENSRIDGFKQDGISDNGIPDIRNVDDRGVVEDKKETEKDTPFEGIQVEPKFAGDWQKFLIRNLDPQVAIDNGAPAGNYTVIIQFVVDKEGNLSDIKPMTNMGYGMEQEAMRVIRKATRWEPAIQNGYKVKAFRLQPITFEVKDSDNR